MLELVSDLFDAFHNEKVVYCHWKSNRNLDKALNGDEDLDLLISRNSDKKARIAMASLGFKRAVQPSAEKSWSIYHYYGLDRSTGKLVHLHIHNRLVTGGSLLKNYRFPIEEKIFNNLREHLGVYTPLKSIELLLLVLRKTIESASLTESFMLWREKEAVQRELKWLLEQRKNVLYGESGAIHLCEQWFPSLDKNVFLRALEYLKGPWKFRQLFLIGNMMAKALGGYSIYKGYKSCVIRIWHFLRKVFVKLFIRQRTHTPYSGGAIVAIVGPDATGKSTVVRGISEWLSEHLKVETVHTGIPPSSIVTWLPNKLIPYLRGVMPKFRTGNIEAEVLEKGDGDLTGFRLLIFILRSLMIAFDRKRLLNKIFCNATKGCIVICDRYPTAVLGAMDSVQIDGKNPAVQQNKLFNRLAEIEMKIYQSMPQPDIVIQLTVPIEIALARNESRDKAGSEDKNWVIRRHQQSQLQQYPDSVRFIVDTSDDLEVTFNKIKHIVWDNI